MARVKRLSLIALLFTVSTWPARPQTQLQQVDSQKEAGASGPQTLRLSPEATQVAEQIGIASLLERLDRKGGVVALPIGLESLALRQEITEKVLAASLDVDSVNAVIDSEVEQIRSIRSDLQAQRDKAQNIINVASLITGGALGVVNSALQFNSGTANVGNGIGVGGGATSVILSLVGIHKQRGGRRVLGDSPRMLARFFGREPGAQEAIPSTYPAAVWSYLNSAAPSQRPMATRKDQLIAKWQREGRVNPDGSPKGELKIESLSGNISQPRRLSIDELSDRVAMLLDVRASVSLMKRELSEILRGLSADKSNQ
jgi:hypothetical protein